MYALDWHALWYNLIHLGAPSTDLHPVNVAEKIVRPIVVYLALVFGLRTVGKRVLAQLNPFDFVVLLTLSNTVQNAIIGNDTSLVGGILGAAALLGINYVLIRLFYRGPSKDQLWSGDRDICLIADGQIDERQMRRLHVNAAELLAKAHERGFDSLDEIEGAMLYPNGTIYFKGKSMTGESERFEEIIRRLDALSAEVRMLRA